MIPITTTLTLMKRIPKVLLSLLIFINAFLLGFLLFGSSQTSSSYSSTYLIEYSFNQTSSMYNMLKSAYASTNQSELSLMKVKVGYLGLCIEVDDSIVCSTASSSDSDLQNLHETYPGVQLYSSGSNSTATSLNLLDIGLQFRDKIIQPYVLIVVLVLDVVMLLNAIYGSIPFLPFRSVSYMISCILGLICCILWGIGAMWAHVAADAGTNLMELGSLSLLEGKSGRKAKAMTWTSFTFFMIFFLGSSWIFIKDWKLKKSKKQSNGGDDIGSDSGSKLSSLKTKIGVGSSLSDREKNWNDYNKYSRGSL